MLNSTIKLIRLTIGYTTNAVAQEAGYTLGYILKLENSKENISKKTHEFIPNSIWYAII